MGKFVVFAAALASGEVVLAVIGIGTAIVSVFYYLRVVAILYQAPMAGKEPAGRVTFGEAAVLVASMAAILLFGILPGPLADAAAALFR